LPRRRHRLIANCASSGGSAESDESGKHEGMILQKAKVRVPNPQLRVRLKQYILLTSYSAYVLPWPSFSSYPAT
jgi:hypothetical protein